MRIHLLKLTITLSIGALFTIYSLNGSTVRAFSGGPDPSLTGAPGELTCSSCHGGGASGGTLSITGLPANYTPNQEVTLTVNLSQAGRTRFGFQLTVIDDTGKRAGDLTPNDGNTQTQLNTVSGNQRQYINHTSSGSNPVSPGQGSWTFKWKAPAQSVGQVTFYISGNAANGNFTTTGDTIYNINQSVQPGSTLAALATVSAASFAPPTTPLAANQIVAGFGIGLAQNVTFPPQGSTTLPLALDGTSIVVRDAMGTVRDAGLFFVAPQQVNYLMPAGTVNGVATVTLRRNVVDTAQGAVNIETVSPGLFTANTSGSGVPAAVLFRRRAGVDTFETVAEFNSATSMFDPKEIDLGPEGDLVLLIAFGSGIRGLTSRSATIGGQNAPVDAVVPAPGFEGLEQINIIIPRSLISSGLVNVVFTADNKPANTVQLRIK